MNEINTTIQEQIKEHFGEKVHEGLYPFYDVVSKESILQGVSNDEVALIKTKKKIEVAKESGSSKDSAIESTTLPQEMNKMLEFSSDVFFSINTEKKTLIYLAGAYEAIYGHQYADFTEKPYLWQNIIDEEFKKAVDSEFELLMTGKVFYAEYSISDRSGTKKWLETKITPKLDNSGTLIRIDGVTKDITRCKNVENALKENENRYNTILQNSTDIIIAINEQSEVVYASNSYYKATGYAADEVKGSFILKHIYQEDLPAFHKYLNIINDHPGKPYGITFRIIKRLGNYIWCEGSITRTQQKNTNEVVIINFRDISERIAIESALKQSEYKFRSLIENATDAILLINEHAYTLYASNSCYRITGLTPNDILGKSALDLIHPDDITAVKEYIGEVLQTCGVSNKPVIYRRARKDGSYMWCEGTATNMLHDPAINGIVCNFRDISATVEYQQQLMQANVELDKLIYSVSHDLRAPLSSMLGIINIMEDQLTGRVVSEEIDMLRTCINKSDAFIRELLDYSRNSKNELKVEEISFKEKINEIVDHLKYMESGNKNVAIATNISNGQAFYSDMRRVDIILSNLISNAIRYSDPDRKNPFVEINIANNAEEAVVVIKDNGIGISKEYQKKVFDMFYRLSNDTPGTGLGLYIVKETLAKLDGKIELVSEPKVGTEITVHIPNLYQKAGN